VRARPPGAQVRRSYRIHGWHLRQRDCVARLRCKRSAGGTRSRGLWLCSTSQPIIVPFQEGFAKVSPAMTYPADRPEGPHAGGDQNVLKSLGRSDTDLYGPLGNWMATTKVVSNSLKVGDDAPDFFLPDENGRLVALASLLVRGPVVLAFLGGSWCSFCRSKARALSRALGSLPVSMAAILPETGRFPKAMKTADKLDCLVLCDVDYGVGLQFGLMYAAPAPIVNQMATRGLNLAVMHGVNKPMLPAPAVFVVATSGKITFAKIDLDYVGSVDPASILQALAIA
jgi:peroxiredoxin